jgi:hypothetical protein
MPGLPDIHKNLKSIHELISELLNSEETPEAIVPELENALELLSKALEDSETVGDSIGLELKERRGVLAEAKEVIQGYQAVMDKASDLDVDLPTVLKEFDIEWPKDEGDFIRRASYWFPIVRRSIPKVMNVLNDLAREMAWRRE